MLLMIRPSPVVASNGPKPNIHQHLKYYNMIIWYTNIYDIMRKNQCELFHLSAPSKTDWYRPCHCHWRLLLLLPVLWKASFQHLKFSLVLVFHILCSSLNWTVNRAERPLCIGNICRERKNGSITSILFTGRIYSGIKLSNDFHPRLGKYYWKQRGENMN